jgi:hypothetical protein
MWRTTKAAAQNQGRPKPAEIRPVRLVPGQTPTCCGATMQPQLAHARDGYGHTIFVTLWRCAQCGKSAC